MGIWGGAEATWGVAAVTPGFSTPCSGGPMASLDTLRSPTARWETGVQEGDFLQANPTGQGFSA